MKSIRKVTLISLLLTSLTCLKIGAQNDNIRLFHIERNKNSSIVCYDLKVENEGINKKNPIHAYWEMPDKNYKKEELSKIQNKLAFGFAIDNLEDDTVAFKLKAYPDRTVKAVYDVHNKKVNTYTHINGMEARLKKLYIFASPPFYNSVEYIILTGYHPETGEEITEKIINS